MSGVRPARDSDVLAMAAIHARAFDDPWTCDVLAGFLAANGGFGLITDDGDMGGFILCRVAASEAEILTLAVTPERRRSGLGAALVRAAVAEAAAKSAETLFLEVAVDNEAALGLYRSSGFSEVGRRPRYYSRASGAADALVLRRDLNR